MTDYVDFEESRENQLAFILQYAKERWDEDYHRGRMPRSSAGWFGYFTIPGIRIPRLKELSAELVREGKLESNGNMIRTMEIE